MSSTNHNNPAPPQPAPPQITTRGREKGAIYRCRPCGCPNRAGWGGLGNSWGPGEEAGFPGGGHGTLTWSPQAYLSMRTDPTPTTTGSAKATGKGTWGSWEPQKGGATSPATPGDRLRKWWTPQKLMEARITLHLGMESMGPILVEFAKMAGRPWNTCHPHQFLIQSHSLGTGLPLSVPGITFPPPTPQPSHQHCSPKAETQGTLPKV